MNNDSILAQIDRQIARLQQARALLANNGSPVIPGRRRGRPKGSTKTSNPASSKPLKSGSRRMTPDGRARIAAAQKARWVALKEARETAPAAKKAAKSGGAKKKATPKKVASVEEQPGASQSPSET